jgi:hypothetical protein
MRAPLRPRTRALTAGLLCAAATTLPGGARAQLPLAARIGKALDAARPALLHHLAKADLGELALCCLAACHDGVPRDDPVMARALDKLARAELEDTYGLALRLMVLAELRDWPGTAELVAHDTGLLLARQTTGGFSYHAHDGWWDLSNTQYAALGLRAAVALGANVPAPIWQLLYQAVRQMQHDDGGFTYRPGQGKPSAYESMTVAGIAVLQVCAQMLALDGPDKQANDQRVARSWAWLAGRKDAIGDRRTHNILYFLYGLERAAILSDVAQVGGIDWYEAGAALLCEQQLGGGGWWGQDEARSLGQRSPRGHAVDTSFAVLFLRRKFQKVQPPVTGARILAAASLGDPADDAAVRAAAARDAAHGEWALPALVPLLRSEVSARRRAAVLALVAITRQDFGIHPWRDPHRDDDAIRRAELWWLQKRAGR